MEQPFPRTSPVIAACLWVALTSGCTGLRPHVDQALWENRLTQRQPRGGADEYRVGCPDVLTVTVADIADWQRRSIPIGVDGRIELGNAGRLRVEGQTASEIGALAASRLALQASQVHVEVADYRSQKVYLFGQVTGLERAIAFRGQETVVELLQRAGGITPAAAPNEVYVIRPHVAQGRPPEVFPVKLRDILLDNDSRTNVTLEPFDQVHIGEMRRSSFGRCIPPIIRPLYDGLCGMYRAGQNAVLPRSADGPTQPEAAIASAAPLALLPPPMSLGD